MKKDINKRVFRLKSGTMNIEMIFDKGSTIAIMSIVFLGVKKEFSSS